MRQWWILFSVVGVVALARCGGTASEGPEPGEGPSQVDGGAPDASTGSDASIDAGSGSPDASTPDASTPDASTPDAGNTLDAGAPDAGGTPDAGAPDAGGERPDAGGIPDAGAPDAGGTPDAGAPDAGGPAPDAGPPDAGGTPDAGAPDAGLPPDGGGEGPDAGTPGGGSGLACTFNSDCPASERCECDVDTGCQCLTGPRGTGLSGIDPCTTGNDCESALCVEGWGAYYCSGECATSADCGPRLPVCAYISFLGQVCIRNSSGP